MRDSLWSAASAEKPNHCLTRTIPCIRRARGQTRQAAAMVVPSLEGCLCQFDGAIRQTTGSTRTQLNALCHEIDICLAQISTCPVTHVVDDNPTGSSSFGDRRPRSGG